MKFGTLHQILNPITVAWPKITIFEIQDGDCRHLENRFFGHYSLTDCPISAKFCMRKQNGMLTMATHNFIYLLKRQHNYTQKNESEYLTNQPHETLKRYLTQSTQWRHYYVLRSWKFLQKFTFSIVNRDRRQWTVKHLHATAGDLLWLSVENFHKCSDNCIIQGLRSADFKVHASKPYNIYCSLAQL